jgi:hypothetical protein
MTETKGIHNYQIQRAYLADDTGVAVGIQRDQLTVNIGHMALVISPELARRITAEITVARLVHDMRYLEDGGLS